jgi:hypothetical protein
MENPEIYENGNKSWYNEEGELHREGDPAVEYINGDKYWYENDKCHRLDGPAIEKENGDKEWYQNGKCHREDGPAIERINGYKFWYQNDKRHRLDGPAIEINENKYWYIEGEEYTEEEYNEKISEMKITNPKIDSYGTKRWYNGKGEFHRKDGPAIEGIDGYKAWYKNGQLHRVDGPAIEWANGDKEWWVNNNRHRENGPAVEYSNGTKEWWLNGNRHRDNEPAIEYANGDKIWYQNGEQHRIYEPAVEQTDGSKFWYVNGTRHRLNGPACEYANGDKVWYQNGELHRIYEPAVEQTDGSKFWWLNGKRHRLDGPACEYANGDKYWYIEGKKYTKEEFNKKVLKMKTTNPEINKYVDKVWRNEKGEFHRVDQNGKQHRLDGPAVMKQKNPEVEEVTLHTVKMHDDVFNFTGKKETPTNTDIIKDRFEKAAYRSASRQMINGISKVIVKIAEQKGMDSFTTQAVGKFFDTELGEALIGAIIGVGIPYIPKINKDKRALKLAEEFQIESMATVTDTVLNEIFTYILPVVSEVLNTLPIRVENESEEEEIINSERVKHAHISDH